MNRRLSTDISRVIIVTVFFVSLLYSFLLLLYSWTIEDNIFNRLVADEAHFIASQYELNGMVTEPKADYMRLIRTFDELPQVIKSELPHNPDKIEYQTSQNSTLHMTVIQLDEQTHYLLADVGKFEVSKDNLPNVLVWLLVFACITSLVALMVSLKVAKKITHPLKRLADALNRDCGARIKADTFPDNEIGFLAKQTQKSFEQLEMALERESTFTKDVSHEIRTPVSIIQNVITTSQSTQQITGKEFAQVKSAVSNINQITNILLALARAESSKTEQVNITALTESVIVNHFELNNTPAGQRLSLDVQLNDEVHLDCNENLISILLTNLLSNMVRHAKGQHASVVLDNKKLVFTNDANTPQITDVTQSGVKHSHSEGLGHGLNLIQRICEQSKWALRVEQTPTQFSVSILFGLN